MYMLGVLRGERGGVEAWLKLYIGHMRERNTAKQIAFIQSRTENSRK